VTSAVGRLRLRSSLGRTVLAVAAGIVLAGGAGQCRGSDTLRAQSRAILIELKSAAELQAQFNNDRGNARLVLLLSPT
jgi:hypothetical protein